jgi:hypothetical protein
VATAIGEPAATDDLTELFVSSVLPALPAKTRALFLGVPVTSDAAGLAFTFSSQTHRARCAEVRSDVEAAVSQHAGRAVAVRLVDDRDADEHIDLTELEDAPAAGTLIDQLTAAFPGAEIIEE